MNTKNLQFKIKFEKELEFYKSNFLYNYDYAPLFIENINNELDLLSLQRNIKLPVKQILYIIKGFIYLNKYEDEFNYLFNEFKKFNTYIELENFIYINTCFINNKNFKKSEQYLFELVSHYLSKKSILISKNNSKILTILNYYFSIINKNDISKEIEIKEHIIQLLSQCFNIFCGKDIINKSKSIYSQVNELNFLNKQIQLFVCLIKCNFFNTNLENIKIIDIKKNILDSIENKNIKLYDFIKYLYMNDKDNFIKYLNKFLKK